MADKLNKLSEDKSSAKENDLPCQICEKEVVKGGILCQICNNWSHCKCVGINPSNSLLKDDQIHWFCKDCNQVGNNLITQLNTLLTTQQALRKDVDSLLASKNTADNGCNAEQVNALESLLENKLSAKFSVKIDSLIKSKSEAMKAPLEQSISAEINAKLEDTVKRHIEEQKNKEIEAAVEKQKEEIRLYSNALKTNLNIDTLREDLERSVDTKISAERSEDREKVRKAIKEESYEQEQIKLRRPNLIIHNLPESSEVAEDVDKAKYIIRDILNIEAHVDISKATRLGYRDPAKDRLFRITLANPHIKKTILSKAPQLRKLPQSSPYCKVYIRPDLTPTQMEASKNLNAELRAIRLQYPDRSFKIIRGKIEEVAADQQALPDQLTPTHQPPPVQNPGSPHQHQHPPLQNPGSPHQHQHPPPQNH